MLLTANTVGLDLDVATYMPLNGNCKFMQIRHISMDQGRRQAQNNPKNEIALQEFVG